MNLSKFPNALLSVGWNRSLSVYLGVRRRTRRHGYCATEPLEVRQLLTGNFELAVTGGSIGADVAQSVVTDSAGNVYTTGSFTGTVDFDPGTGTVNLTSVGLEDIFVTKSDSSGGFLWARRFGGTGADRGLGISVTATGSAVLTGLFSGTAGFDSINLTSAGSTDVFVTRLDVAGITDWAVRVGGTSNDIGNGVFVDGVGGIYVTGRFESVADFNPGAGISNRTASGIDGFVLKLNSSGTFSWVGQLSGLGTAEGRAVTVDPAGRVYVAGAFTSTMTTDAGDLTAPGAGNVSDAFVARLSSSGTVLWARRMGGTAVDEAYAIATNAQGLVFVAGSFQLAADFGSSTLTADGPALVSASDVFVTRLDQHGTFQSSARFGGNGSDAARGIAIGSDGLPVIVGVMAATWNNGTASLTSNGSSDAFIMGLGPGNFPRWVANLGGASTDEANAVAIGRIGGVWSVGSYAGTADFDPGDAVVNRVSLGSTDYFLSRLSPDLSFDMASTITGVVTLRRNGDAIELIEMVGGTNLVHESHPIAGIRGVRITGRNNNDDTVIVDFSSGGTFAFSNGIQFNAGTGPDDNRLQLIGVGNEGFSYEPSAATTGSGRVLAYGMSVQFENTQNVGVSGTQNLSIESQGSSDLLSVSGTTGWNNSIASKVQGVSNGVTITPLTFDNIRNVTIDTGLRDQLLTQSNDAVSFAAGSLEAVGLTSLFVRTGKGNDTVTINSADLGLPVSGGAFWVLGGAGEDELIVTGNANWDLNDTRLVSSGGGRLAHDELEKAQITGGVSNNIIDTRAFSGSVRLNGGAGNDFIRSGTGHDFLLGGTGNDRLISGDGDDTIYGQDGNDVCDSGAGEDLLRGGAGIDTLFGGDDDDWLFGDAGLDQLIGGYGNDKLDVGADGGNYELWGTIYGDVMRFEILSTSLRRFIRQTHSGLLLEEDQLAVIVNIPASYLVKGFAGADELLVPGGWGSSRGVFDGGDGIDRLSDGPVGGPFDPVDVELGI